MTGNREKSTYNKRFIRPYLRKQDCALVSIMCPSLAKLHSDRARSDLPEITRQKASPTAMLKV